MEIHLGQPKEISLTMSKEMKKEIHLVMQKAIMMATNLVIRMAKKLIGQCLGEFSKDGNGSMVEKLDKCPRRAR